MAAPLKILTVFGTRPEAIKLFPLIHALDADPRFDSRVCISAQHREMLDQVLSIAKIVPDYDLDLMTPGQSLDALTARALVEIGRVLDDERPDWVVVQGDTTTVMAGAIAAYYRRIPVCHVEAGLRSGDIYQPWPEEVNRRVVGSFAALHCAPTQTARDALLRENVEAATVHVTGNTVIDALRWVTQRVSEQPALAAGLAELEARFAGKRIIGMTSHRRENFGEGMENIAAAVQRLAARDDVAIIFPVHLNPNVTEPVNKSLDGKPNIHLMGPLDYLPFVYLMDRAYLVITDSGGIQEEAPSLGKPVLVMRDVTERPEALDAGTAKLVGTDKKNIVAEAVRLLNDEEAYATMSRAHNPYGDGNAAGRIVEELSRDL